MDITDHKIIEILQSDGRISMKDLGKIVGLTSPAVSERVKRLEEAGIGFGNDNYMRLSYATSLENIKEGLDRIEKAIQG